MRKTLGLLAALLIGQGAWAADVFVRDARGSGVSSGQADRVTDMVKTAVRQMPEHTLVYQEGNADFILQPTLLSRGGERFLRLQKIKDDEVISSTEEPISQVNNNDRGAVQITQSTLEEDQYVSGDNYGTRSPASENESSVMAQGETRGASPRSSRLGGIGFFSVGVGPSFAVGLDADNVLYNINAAYNIDFSQRWTGKVMGDLHLPSGSDGAHFYNIGLGANFYPVEQVSGGRPYIGGDLGWAEARNNNDNSESGLTIGAGAGFQFQAQALAMDVGLHYTILTQQIDSDTASVLGLRLAVNF